MDRRVLCLFVIMLGPIVLAAWSSEELQSTKLPHRDAKARLQKKKQMPIQSPRKRATTKQPRPRERTKKPSGHLAPLDEDDMNNDEVVSVAVGPTVIRPRFDKNLWRAERGGQRVEAKGGEETAVGLLRNVMTQMAQEFILRQVDENFVFGQYVGTAMKNLNNTLRLSMQHDILELVLRYQKLNKGDVKPSRTSESVPVLDDPAKVPDRKILGVNATEESWADISSLAKIVG